MRKAYKVLFVLLLIGGIGDFASTIYGLSLPPKIVGYELTTHFINGEPQVLGQPILKQNIETRQFYFPFLSTLILSVAGYMILFLTYSLKSSLRYFGFALTGCLVALSFSGLANNLLFI
jgi:hypothetical protein